MWSLVAGRLDEARQAPPALKVEEQQRGRPEPSAAAELAGSPREGGLRQAQCAGQRGLGRVGHAVAACP